ncbi:hypothetical protein EVAR_57561_1 [Eumeta japonica]|uniref:Uncharacterized protein n=1 Tax=Eumeta variegata TaxID=151549 RepID=A0A4C2A0A0_EUMVA|nr:hypothetical protein EVAR_57561_1 [Eumeta japonica]
MGLRRLITEFLWPPSSSINRSCYHIVSKYCQEELKSPNSMVASFNYGVPMATFQLHQQTLVTIVSKYSSRRIKEPKLDRVASFNYEFLWPPSSSINRSALRHNNIALSSYLYMHANFI